MSAWLKKNLKYLLPIAITVFFLLLPENAYAQEFFRFLKYLKPRTWVEEILKLILELGGLILGFAGIILELSIQYTVVKMKDFVDGISSIDLAWRTIRDIANILFVFVLLLISINIILGSWASGPYNKGLIPKVIIAALLINFSLFFTKVAIDVSNIIAFEFYDTAKSIRSSGTIELPGGVTIDTGLTSSFMQALGVTKIATDEAAAKFAQSSYPVFSLIMGIITTLVAAFVFMVMAAMLMVRFVMFIFLMITSPIVFIGELLPQLNGYSKQWKQTLAAQATFAPIFFALILIVVLIINDSEFGRLVTSSSGSFGESVDDAIIDMVSILFQYAIVIGLTVAALVAAKKASNNAGEGFVKWSSKLAGKAAFGGTAALGSMTIGRMGRAAAESGTFNRWAAGTGVTGLIGKGLVQSGGALGKASFDVRATTVGKDLGAGDAAKGYTERRKAAAKAEGEYIKKATVPVRNPNVQAADNRLREIRSRYTEVQRKFESGEIDLDDRTTALREIETAEQSAKQDLSAARRGALAGAIGTAALRTVTPWRGVTDESRARHTLARATRKVKLDGIREIETMRKKAEEKLKDEKEGKKPSAKEVTERLKANLKEANKQDHLAYVEALEGLEDVQKKQKDANKDFQREFAGKKQGSTIGYMRDAADKVRKDLGESSKDKAWESMKKAIEEAEGGDKGEKSGEKPAESAKPTESEKPKTS